MSNKLSAASPTRLSRYTGKIYDRATGEYLGRIERLSIFEDSKFKYIVWKAFERGGKKHELASLKDARRVLYQAGQRVKELLL